MARNAGLNARAQLRVKYAVVAGDGAWRAADAVSASIAQLIEALMVYNPRIYITPSDYSEAKNHFSFLPPQSKNSLAPARNRVFPMSSKTSIEKGVPVLRDVAPPRKPSLQTMRNAARIFTLCTTPPGAKAVK